MVEENLLWLTEDNVAYDMDEVFIEESIDISTGELDTSDEGESDVHWKEEE